MIIRRTLGPGMSEYLASRVRATPNVVIHERTEIESVCGKSRLEEIVVRTSSTGLQTKLPCAAIFVFIGRRARCRLAAGGDCPRQKDYLLDRFRRYSVGLMAED